MGKSSFVLMTQMAKSAERARGGVQANCPGSGRLKNKVNTKHGRDAVSFSLRIREERIRPNSRAKE